METRAVPTSHDGRKHLQRLIRKVRLVLIVKHLIDDLKGGTGLRLCQEDLEQKHPILTDLPNGKDATTDLDVLDCAVRKLDSAVDRTVPSSTEDDSLSKSLAERLLEAIFPGNSRRSIENQLDSFITTAVEVVRRSKEFFLPPSQDFWTRWAKKRSASVLDHRAKTILTKFNDQYDEDMKKLHTLEGTLEDYIRGNYDRVPESLSDVIRRLRAVFGVGWFFEWPSGRHPLNSTWPWTDVKPSLVVLWGVCWMFFPALYTYPSPGQDSRSPRSQLHDDDYFLSQYPGSSHPITSSDARHFLTMLPAAASTTLQQSRPSPTTMRGPQGIGSPYGCFEGQDFSSHSGYSAQSPRGASPRGLGTALDIRCSSYLFPDHASHVFNDRYSRPNTRDVAQSDSWMIQPRQPDPLGENSVQPYKATTSRTINSSTWIHDLLSPLYPLASSISAPMPSSTTFSYPPLDNMNEMHHPQPYMVEPERAYNQMPDPHDYHDAQQEQPRYPSPPAAMGETPYHGQQATGGPADGRMEMPTEPKSESDGNSPGRSKPVPKPDREVTKDSNGRFFCNWVGCTEEVKDFGRKCEWSKHMDKHDRPYKCPAEGCEKLPGFTYSGGLLRHEREVHNKHGGPRKQLNCPHLNCKRHTGKGFSRQENLNEHLRRVHTDAGLPLNGEETEDDASEAQAGGKRKRTRGESADMRDEVKRLRQENEELRRQAEAQTQQSSEMMRQIMQLQQAQQLQATMQHPRMQAPPAQMT